MSKLNKLISINNSALYQLEDSTNSKIKEFISTTDETRNITNNSLICGVEYTNLLKNAASKTFTLLHKANVINANETSSSVVNILRGGLNFGLREALNLAYNWNSHSCIFLSAQRYYNQAKEEWLISENDYKKLVSVDTKTLIMGDVVATGTSLKFAIESLLKFLDANKIEEIVFFTIGARTTREIFEEVLNDNLDIEVKIVYYEGIFSLTNSDASLKIKIDGTDLIRKNAILSEEFIEFQKINPAFPLERCAIYDAGSRAFDPLHYLEDVKDYWGKVLLLAKNGMTYNQYLHERMPELVLDEGNKVSLIDISKKYIY